MQAFRLADLRHGGEFSYISIFEIIKNGVELDLYWTPKSLSAINGVDKTEPKAEEVTEQPTQATTQSENQENTAQTAFEAELNSLKLETDIFIYDE